MAGLRDAVTDVSLQALIDDVTAIHLTNGFDPSTNDRAWVIANSLANAAVVAGNWTGPVDGPVDGRMVTLASLTGTVLANLAAGAGDLRIVLITAADWYYWANETSERELVLGESIDFPAIPIRIRDPA